MSAITGICDLPAITDSASASSCVGHATRTIWHPDAVSSAICCSVAPMSDVRVVVIDCTDTGASPPTATDPTWILRLLRRSARGRTGDPGIPRETAVTASLPVRRDGFAHGAQRLLQGAHGGEDGGGLVAAVRHAVGAARVLAAAVLVPVGVLDQLPVRRHVAVAHQVAGALPAEQGVVGDGPGGAREVDLALEEVEEQRGVVQPPAPAVAARERLLEQLPGLLHAEEVLLVGRLLVGVGGRDHHLVDLEVVVEVVEHLD